jgi:hypothetical protein
MTGRTGPSEVDSRLRYKLGGKWPDTTLAEWQVDAGLTMMGYRPPGRSFSPMQAGDARSAAPRHWERGLPAHQRLPLRIRGVATTRQPAKGFVLLPRCWVVER